MVTRQYKRTISKRVLINDINKHLRHRLYCRETNFLVIEILRNTIHVATCPTLRVLRTSFKNSMKQNSSSDANRFSASQEIPRILWNLKVHDLIHKNPPTVPVLVPFPLLKLHKGIRPRRRQLWMVHNVVTCRVRSCQHLAQHPRWRTTTFLLSATAYSTYPQLHSIFVDRSFIRDLRTRRAVVTETHLLW